jgi:hypothetical protein
MLGYEPPQPNFRNALITAVIVVFPVFYFLDAGLFGRRPGWLYLLTASGATLLLAYQLYSGVGRYAGTKWSVARSLLPKRDTRQDSDLD